MNRLQVLVSEESYRRNRSFLFCDFFVELCELAEACYGFANIHVDSTDSQAMNECYKNTIDLLPVDCINSSRYISDSDWLIKDVCWLNFISNRHLEQLPLDTKVFLSEMPFYRKNDRGVYFAVADDPYMGEKSYERIRKLRQIFQPVICEDDWYKFV